MNNNLLHSFVADEVPARDARRIAGGSAVPAPEKLVVPGRCGIHQRAFLLLVERGGGNTWKVLFAIPAPPDRGDTWRGSPGLLPIEPLEVRGSVVLARDYTGCPFCGGETIFSCGCGVLNCSGARRMHGAHKEYLCGGCGRWRCIGKGGTMDSLTGFAAARPPVKVELPCEIPGTAVPRSLNVVAPTAIEPGTALVPRR